MKKPYFYLQAVMLTAFLLLMRTSFAQEVENQQQIKSDVTNVTEEDDVNAASNISQNRATPSVNNSRFDEMTQNFLAPVDPNAALSYQASHTVDQCTGKVNVNVPLAVAGPKDIPIPVELNYTTGGIKLGERASWTGLGWNLSAGGKITRMMNKFPDKLDGSLDTLAHYTGWSFILTTMDHFTGNFEDRLKNQDTQPDLFTFELPGRSGTFVFDPRGNAYTIPYQNVKINYDKSNEVFEIIDEMGTVYLFEHKEITEIMNMSSVIQRDNARCVSAWYVSSITDVNGETVEFEYKMLDKAVNKDQKYDFDTYQHNTTLALGGMAGSGSTSGAHRVSYLTQIYPLFLTKISWKNGRMDFVSSMRRKDHPTESYQLDAIKVYAGVGLSKLVKTFEFQYSAFFGCNALKLDRINLSTPRSTTSEFYREFEYFTDDSVPAIALGNHYYEHDHWGFYNGKTKNTLGIPAVHLVDENGNYVHDMPAYDDRTPVLAKTVINSLKRIWVTTSGYEEFEYELNESRAKVDYYSGYTVGGLRIKSITTKSEELTAASTKVMYEYLDTDGKSSGVVFNNPAHYHKSSYDPADNVNFYVLTGASNRRLFDLDGSHIRYKRVRELFDNGSTNTYTFTTYEDRPDDGFYVHPLVTYGAYYNYEGLKIRNCDFSPTNTRFWERGLLIEKVSKNNLGSETYRETNEYELDAPVKKDIKGIYAFTYQGIEQGAFRPLSPTVAQYHYLSRPIYMSKQTVSGVDIPETVTTFTHDDDYNQLTEKKVRCGNDVYITTYKYPFDYPISYEQEYGNAIKFMRDNNILTAPIEVVNYKNGKIVGGELSIYGTWSYVLDANTDHPSMSSFKFNLKEVKELMLNKPKLQSEFTKSALTRFSSNGLRFTYDNGYVTKTKYEYNLNTTLSCIKERGKPSRLFLYGRNPELLVAQISNAEAKVADDIYYLEEAFYTSFEDSYGRAHDRAKTGEKVLMGGYYTDMSKLAPGSYNVSYWESTNDGVDWELYESEVEVMENDNRQFTIGGRNTLIDEYRIWKKGAQMETRTYNSDNAVTSVTDANGKTAYFEYDEFGRVVLISDNDRNKVKKYKYFIKAK